MPIEYESAAPMGAIAGVANSSAILQAQRERFQHQAQAAQLAAAAGHGGGYGGGGGGMDTQSAILAAAGLRQQQDQFATTRQQVSADELFKAQTGAAMQRQSYDLQAQLHDTELTQQEKMRLYRMRNAVGDVTNDPSLSDGEKSDMILQLKTGIDPLQHRLAAQKVQAEEMQKKAMVEQYQAQAALKKQEAEVTAKTAAERTSFIPDFQSLAAISQDLAQSGQVPQGLSSEEFDQYVHQKALQEAQRQGLGVWKFQEGYGKWSDLAGINSQLEGHNAGKGATGTHAAGGGHTSDHPTGLAPLDYLKAFEQAENQAHKEQSMTTEGDIPGTKKSVYPQTTEWKDNRVKEIMAKRQLPTDMAEYAKQTPAKAGAAGLRYDRTKSPWNPQSPAAAPADAAPAAAAATPAGGKVPEGANLASFATDRDFIAKATGIEGYERTAATYLLNDSEKIMKAYPDPTKLPPDVRKKLEENSRNMKAILSKAKPPAPAPGPQAGVWVPANDGLTDFGRGLNRLRAGARRVLDNYQPAQGGGGGY